MSPPPCTRCGSPAFIHIPSTPRCLSCFQQYLQRTFKSALGQLHLSGRGPPPWVCVSGGPCSSAVALLLHNYIHSLPSHPKYPTPQLHLLHILPSSSCSIPPSVQWLSQLPLVSLHTSILPSQSILRDPSDTSQLLRDAYLHAMIQASQGNPILLGITASRAAVDVLTSVISARPGLVSYAAALKSTIDEVCVAKPVRDLPTRMLIRYARVKMDGVKFSPAGMLMGRVRAPMELERDLYLRVEKFVTEVELGNPAAVHNIVKTAARLIDKEGTCCMLCGGKGLMEESKGDDSCQNNGEGGCGNCHGAGKRMSDLENRLCRGCQDILERANVVGEKERVLEVIKTRENETGGRRRKVGVEEMRKEIEEFLL